MAQNEQICAKILVWFRRDLRTHDHAAFYHALKAGRLVYCAFVIDHAVAREKTPERYAKARKSPGRS